MADPEAIAARQALRQSSEVAAREELDRLLMELSQHERSPGRGGRVVMLDRVKTGNSDRVVAPSRATRSLGGNQMIARSTATPGVPAIKMDQFREFDRLFRETASRYPNAADTIDYLDITDVPERTGGWMASGRDIEGRFAPGSVIDPADYLNPAVVDEVMTGRVGHAVDSAMRTDALGTGVAQPWNQAQLTQSLGMTPSYMGMTDLDAPADYGKIFEIPVQGDDGWARVLNQQGKQPLRHTIPHEFGHGRLEWGLNTERALQPTLDYLLEHPDNQFWSGRRNAMASIGDPGWKFGPEAWHPDEMAQALGLDTGEYMDLLRKPKGVARLNKAVASAKLPGHMSDHLRTVRLQSDLAQLPTMRNPAESGGKFGSIYGLTSMHEGTAEQVAKEAFFINNPTTDFYGIGRDDMARLADDPLGWWGTLNQGQQRNVHGIDPAFARYKNWDMDLRKADFSTGAIDPGEILPGLQSRGALRQGLRAKPLALTGAGIAASEALARTLPEGYRDYARGAGYGASLAPVLGGGTVRGALKAAPALAMAGLGAAFVKDQFFD